MNWLFNGIGYKYVTPMAARDVNNKCQVHVSGIFPSWKANITFATRKEDLCGMPSREGNTLKIATCAWQIFARACTVIGPCTYIISINRQFIFTLPI